MLIKFFICVNPSDVFKSLDDTIIMKEHIFNEKMAK